MTNIEYFKLQAKNLFRDWKTKVLVKDEVFKDLIVYEYSPKYFDVSSILFDLEMDEDDFSLVFIEEDETKMYAVLNVRDVDGFFRLGTFTFSNSAKYEGKAFFTFENGALYRVYTRVPNGEPMNHICDLMYVADFYGMTFNNVTELELAFDSNYNYISKVRKMIKDIISVR